MPKGKKPGRKPQKKGKKGDGKSRSSTRPTKSSKQNKELKDETLYCICRQKWNGLSMMAQCDACKEWYHGKCVGVTSAEIQSQPHWVCPQCKAVREGKYKLKHYFESNRDFSNNKNALYSSYYDKIDPLQTYYLKTKSLFLKENSQNCQHFNLFKNNTTDAYPEIIDDSLFQQFEINSTNNTQNSRNNETQNENDNDNDNSNSNGNINTNEDEEKDIILTQLESDIGDDTQSHDKDYYYTVLSYLENQKHTVCFSSFSFEKAPNSRVIFLILINCLDFSFAILYFLIFFFFFILD